MQVKIPDFFKECQYVSQGDEPMVGRFDEISYIMRNLPNKKGLILQFGVYLARTLNHIAYHTDKTVYGFDSFEGLPEDWDMGQKFVKKTRFKMDELPKVLDNVELVKGFFDESLPKWLIFHANEPISFLDIDSDLYSSAKTVLTELNNHIVPGTVIRFDELTEWRYFGDMGCKKFNRTYYKNWKEGEYMALNEWLEEFDRHVIPFSRDQYQAGTVKVVK